MTLSWPASLPSPAVNGFQKKQRSNTVSSTTAQGLQRSRQRFTGKVWDFLVSLPPLTATKLAAFETFYKTTTKSGTLEFDWYDFSKDPFVASTFKFKADTTPDITALTSGDAGADSLWRVSFTLEMRS